MCQMSTATPLILALGISLAAPIRANEPPTIVHLVMRDRVVTIANGPDGSLYSVSTKDNRVLDANLNKAQLEAKYPDVYDNVRPAVASSKVPLSRIWAGTFEKTNSLSLPSK